MLWSERFVQDQKRQTDCAIHRVGIQLASNPSEFDKFHELLRTARKRSARLFEAPILGGCHLGIEALKNLARFRAAHVGSAGDWAGTTSSWRPAISSLAHHVICNYKVPAFLASSWYATDPAADNKRAWFVAHSRGACFRSLDLPMAMTRKMERIFLASQDHLSIEHALRSAELLALGASSEFVRAIMLTRLAADLRDSEFWRTVWAFVVANARDLDHTQIGPMIDYIQAVRREAAFSMKGRTVQSMLRLMRDWHRSLGSGNAAFSWAPSPFKPLLLEEPEGEGPELPRRWHMIELTNSAQLRAEGAALHHCVASYGDRCYRGVSSIWSLRYWRGEKVYHTLTVEVDVQLRAIIQVRGKANRSASGKPLRLLKDWADRERLRIAI